MKKEVPNFKVYSKKEKLQYNSNVNEIITYIGKLNDQFGDYKEKTKMTCEVKIALVGLGHKQGFKVYSRVFNKKEWEYIKNKERIDNHDSYTNTEWLYDLHWYNDLWDSKNQTGEKYSPTVFELACECEWSKNKATNPEENLEYIGYDFQKLLFSNANINLFICRAHKSSHADEILKYASSAIKNYNQIKKNAVFILLCFNREMQKMLYEVIYIK